MSTPFTNPIVPPIPFLFVANGATVNATSASGTLATVTTTTNALPATARKFYSLFAVTITLQAINAAGNYATTNTGTCVIVDSVTGLTIPGLAATSVQVTGGGGVNPPVVTLSVNLSGSALPSGHGVSIVASDSVVSGGLCSGSSVWSTTVQYQSFNR